MKMIPLVVLVFIALTANLTTFFLPVLAGCSNEQLLTAPVLERPQLKDALQTATNVYIGLQTFKIYDIDPVNSSYKADFYVYLTWRDDRLNALPDGSRIKDITTVWNALPEFINYVSGTADTPWKLYVYTKRFPPEFSVKTIIPRTNDVTDCSTRTWMQMFVRFHMTFSSRIQVENFPYDHHIFHIAMESEVTPHQMMVFVFDNNNRNAMMPSDPSDGWKLTAMDGQINAHRYEALDEVYSRAIFKVKVSRIPDFFVSNYITGISILVFMAIFLFFIPAYNSDRLGFTQTCFMGVLSWKFILSQQFPNIGYSTLMDGIMMLGLVTIFIAFSYSAVVIGFFPEMALKDKVRVEKTAAQQELQRHLDIVDVIYARQMERGLVQPQWSEDQVKAEISEWLTVHRLELPVNVGSRGGLAASVGNCETEGEQRGRGSREAKGKGGNSETPYDEGIEMARKYKKKLSVVPWIAMSALKRGDYANDDSETSIYANGEAETAATMRANVEAGNVDASDGQVQMQLRLSHLETGVTYHISDDTFGGVDPFFVDTEAVDRHYTTYCCCLGAQGKVPYTTQRLVDLLMGILIGVVYLVLCIVMLYTQESL